jgi:hypothetical protein
MALVETVGSLLFNNKRSIMGLFADVVVSENHTDKTVITEHPVEKGAPISDHCYSAPAEVTMEIGWSESAGKLNKMLGNTFLGGDLSLVAIYEALRALQGNLLIISTGKRLYTNMLIETLQVTTDATSENALMVKVNFKKVNIAKTKETTVQVEEQADPAAIGPIQEGGTKQAKPVDTSTAGQIFGGAQVGGGYEISLRGILDGLK